MPSLGYALRKKRSSNPSAWLPSNFSDVEGLRAEGAEREGVTTVAGRAESDEARRQPPALPAF